MQESDAVILPGARVTLYKKRRVFSQHIASALLFIFVFTIGCAGYLLLSPTFRDFTYPADERLSLLFAIPTTAEGVIRLLFFATSRDALLLSLLFLFSFSFFTPLLVKGLLAVRALRLSVWLCRLHDMTRAGILAPHLFVALVCFEAVTVTLLIVFSTRAQSLSRSLRYSKEAVHFFQK